MAASGAVPACASRPAAEAAPAPRPEPQTRSGALVFAPSSLREADALALSTAPSSSWAFSRKDAALAVRSPGPLLATDQWPQPVPPRERPIWFRRWVQH